MLSREVGIFKTGTLSNDDARRNLGLLQFAARENWYRSLSRLDLGELGSVTLDERMRHIGVKLL